jgi:hypothetical protein
MQQQRITAQSIVTSQLQKKCSTRIAKLARPDLQVQPVCFQNGCSELVVAPRNSSSTTEIPQRDSPCAEDMIQYRGARSRDTTHSCRTTGDSCEHSYPDAARTFVELKHQCCSKAAAHKPKASQQCLEKYRKPQKHSYIMQSTRAIIMHMVHRMQ